MIFLIAYLLFAIVILAVLTGIAYITAHGLGWTVNFTPLPTFTHK